MGVITTKPFDFGVKNGVISLIDPRIRNIENDPELDLFDVFSALELIAPDFLNGEIDNRQWQSRTMSIRQLDISLEEKIRLLKKGVSIIFWYRENKIDRYKKLLSTRDNFLEDSFEKNVAIASLIGLIFSKREIARIYERTLF